MTRKLHAVPQIQPRAVIYVRQSVAREESISPAVQEQSCRDYADRRGYTVTDVIADVGVSGLKWEKRPGIQRVIAAIKATDVDVVLVWRWSRLSRSRLHQAVALDAVEKAGGVVESATEPFDTTTAGGRFGREVMLAAAAFESQQKAEQWADAHRRRLDRGLPASGGARLGYRLVDGHYQPDRDTAPIVGELFDRYNAGAGLEQLADWLHTMDVVSPRRGGGQRWTKRGVGYFMASGFAAGLLRVRGELMPGAHPPVITEMVWRRYLDEHARRTVTAPRLLHPTTRLAGLVRCAGCGRSMTTKTVNGRPQWVMRCSNRECPDRAWCRRDLIEDTVRGWLGDGIAQAVEQAAAAAPPVAVTKTTRARLARTVASAETALGKLTADLARGLVPESAYAVARDELARERDTAAQELRALDTATVSTTGAVTAAAGLLDVWDEGDPQAVNAVARTLLQVRVHGRSPGRVEVLARWEAVGP